jgi:hypothetical protein
MFKKLILISLILIFATNNLFARDRDYECEPTQFHTNPEYYNVIFEPENNKVIYIWKLPSSIQFVKANNIIEIKDDIIFYEEFETYYENGNTFKTGKKDLKKIIIDKNRAVISTVGNNVEWITHKCVEIK